ncbi:MAG: antibiotic biosynthesis monooxygenase [Candidatus Deferrimicrobiaceae bacterium]
MVGLEVIVRVHPYRRVEFLQAVRMVTDPAHPNTGCAGQCLFEDVGEPNRFLWMERWSGSDHLNEYMRTDRFRSLLGAFSVVGSIEEMHVTDLLPAA